MIDRRRPRLKAYDYRTPGAYFITVCCEHREMWFDPKLPYREIVDEEIRSFSLRYAYLEIPKYVVMPNHLHFLMVMKDCVPIEQRKEIPRLVGELKSLSTRACRKAGFPKEHLYQTSFYEHIVRTEQDYAEIWQYIDTNPQRWEEDRYFSR